MGPPIVPAPLIVPETVRPPWVLKLPPYIEMVLPAAIEAAPETVTTPPLTVRVCAAPPLDPTCNEPALTDEPP